MKKSTNLIITSVVLITLVFVLVLYNLSDTGLPGINNDEVFSFSEGWQYSLDGSEFEQCANPTELTGREAEIIILKNVFPDIDEKFSTIHFFNSRNFLKVYIEDNLVYNLDETMLSTIGEAPGVMPLMIELPNIKTGDEILIELRPAYKIAEVDSLYLATESSGVFHLLNREFLSFILSTLMVVLGVGEVVFFLFIFTKKRATHILHLGFFTIITGLYTFSTLPMVQLFVSEPYIYSVASYLLLYLMPIPILFFLCSAYNLKYSKHLYACMYLHILFWLVVIMLQAYNLRDLRYSLSTYHMLIGLSIFALAATAVFEIFVQKNTKIRAFGFSALVLCIFSAIDMFTYYIDNEAYMSTFLRIGVIGFSAVLLAEFLRELSEIMKETARSKLYEKLAFEDILTNSKNRTCFERDFEHFKTNPELLKNLVLGMFDINDLKKINDNLGHKEGDMLIQSATEELKKTFNDVADIYRIGGDEFTLISTNIKQNEIKDYLDKLQQNIDTANKTLPFRLSIAGELCSYDDKLDKGSADSLLKRVDAEMYKRKAIMKGYTRRKTDR